MLLLAFAYAGCTLVAFLFSPHYFTDFLQFLFRLILSCFDLLKKVSGVDPTVLSIPL